MKNKIKFLFLLLLVYSCSLDTKSGFWSKTEKINDEKIKKLFVEQAVLDKEFNTNILIACSYIIATILLTMLATDIGINFSK